MPKLKTTWSGKGLFPFTALLQEFRVGTQGRNREAGTKEILEILLIVLLIFVACSDYFLVQLMTSCLGVASEPSYMTH